MPAPALRIGSVTIIPLSDGAGSVGPERFFNPPHPEGWGGYSARLDEHGNFPLNFGCFLLREGETLTLVDTGLGAGPQRPNAGRLLDELGKAGVTPEQIERVILTHLHFDHIGWNTVERDGARVPVFVNARHVVQQCEWDALPRLIEASSVVKHAMEPVAAAGLLELVDGDVALTSAISTLLAPGHTPGHQAVLVRSGGEGALIIGDLAHWEAQLEHTDWHPGADMDPEQAARSRAAVFDRIEREGLTMGAGHFPYPSLGTIVRVEGRRCW